MNLDKLKENYTRPDPPIYKPLRRVSIRLSYWCIQWQFSPHILTALSFIFSCLSAFSLFYPDLWKLSVVFILISYILDCMDGEVARGSNKSSLLGSQLEHISHWFIIGIIQVGAVIGAFKFTNDWVILLLGFGAIIGWYGFYFLYLQLRVWISPTAHVPKLRTWSKLLFKIMPLDENLLFIVLVYSLPIYVMVSSIVSLTLFSITFCLFMLEHKNQ